MRISALEKKLAGSMMLLLLFQNLRPGNVVGRGLIKPQLRETVGSGRRSDNYEK